MAKNKEQFAFLLLNKCYLKDNKTDIKNSVMDILKQYSDDIHSALMKQTFLSSIINLHLSSLDKTSNQLSATTFFCALNGIAKIPKYKIMQTYLSHMTSDISVLEELKTNGWNLNLINNQSLNNTHYSLLYWAVPSAKKELISYLLNEGLDTKEIDIINKQSVLFHALQHKVGPLTLDLIYSHMQATQSFDANELFKPIQSNKYKNRLTHNLIKSDNIESISWLLNKGYAEYFNLPNSELELPIHRAVSLQIYETISSEKNTIAILSNNKEIKLNEKNKRGLTIIHIAQNFKHYKMVEYLISKGADPTLPRGKLNQGMNTIEKTKKDLNSPLMGAGARASEEQLSLTLASSESIELQKDINLITHTKIQQKKL